MISADKALQIILDNTRVLETGKIPLLDSIDLVLAEDIIAREDYPPFDKSIIDGFAARSADITASDRGKPTILILDGESRVGAAWGKPVKPGHAVKVSAGALLPEGADTVVPADHAVRENAKKVLIYKAERPGEHIELKGDDIESGSTVLPMGHVIAPSDIGHLASIGICEVVCHRRPKVTFFSSGNELISVDCPMEQGKIRASVNYALQVQLERFGVDAVNLGILELNADKIKECIDKAGDSDMVIVTSGTSGNDFDHLKIILQKYGLDLKFWRVAIKPRKPFVFGTIEHVPVFGFSDHIGASMLLLEQFVRPSIMKMQGRIETRRLEVMAKLEKDIRGGNGLTHFIRAEVRITEEGFVALPHSSHDMLSPRSFYSSNGFIVLPPEIPGYSAGEKVKVQIVENPVGQN